MENFMSIKSTCSLFLPKYIWQWLSGSYDFKIRCQYILPFYSLCFVSFLSVIVNMKSCIQIAQLWNNPVGINKRLYDAWLMHRKLEPLCCKRGSNHVISEMSSWSWKLAIPSAQRSKKKKKKKNPTLPPNKHAHCLSSLQLFTSVLMFFNNLVGDGLQKLCLDRDKPRDALERKIKVKQYVHILDSINKR